MSARKGKEMKLFRSTIQALHTDQLSVYIEYVYLQQTLNIFDSKLTFLEFYTAFISYKLTALFIFLFV